VKTELQYNMLGGEKVKANELRGRIVAQGMTVGELCERYGFVRSTFGRKLTGKSECDRGEIERIIAALDLTQEETRNIFFADGVA
jgi:hypothetical protein